MQKLLNWMILGTSICGYASMPTLQEVYEQHCRERSDICEHLPPLRDLAQECTSVIEIGVRSMVSTWGILQGLSESSAKNRTYLGIDLHYPPKETLQLADTLATKAGVLFSFWKGNDMTINLPSVDFLFIDSLHTYCHLTYELETFAPQVQKYIALHDTSPPWELRDDDEYWGDYLEYPSHIDRSKRGLWPAVQDFLFTHSDWVLEERRTNCHGLTVLKRVDPNNLKILEIHKKVPVKFCLEKERQTVGVQKSNMKILYTSALIPNNYEERRHEYIHSLQVLEKIGFISNTYVIESGSRTTFSFFDKLCPHVFYSGTNNLSLHNKGVNELKSLINFCKFHDIGDDEMIVKLTGRYFFENDSFLKYIASHPELDGVVSFRETALDNSCLQTGCFAIKGKYFKIWLQRANLQKLEDEMIDIEWDFTRYVRSLVSQGAKIEIMDKMGVTAHVADSYVRYY